MAALHQIRRVAMATGDVVVKWPHCRVVRVTAFQFTEGNVQRECKNGSAIDLSKSVELCGEKIVPSPFKAGFESKTIFLVTPRGVKKKHAKLER